MSKMGRPRSTNEYFLYCKSLETGREYFFWRRKTPRVDGKWSPRWQPFYELGRKKPLRFKTAGGAWRAMEEVGLSGSQFRFEVHRWPIR